MRQRLTALGLMAAVDFAKALRWQVLYGQLRPSYRRVLQAQVVGQAANTLVPLRLGEVLRVSWAAPTPSGVARGTAGLVLTKAVDAVAKGSILLTYRKLIDELGPFDRVVRFVGGRRNIYVWILAVGILLAVPAKAFITIAWWEVVTAAVHIPRAAWALWAFRESRRGIR